MKGFSSEIFWRGAVIVLVGAVSVQSYIIWKSFAAAKLPETSVKAFQTCPLTATPQAAPQQQMLAPLPNIGQQVNSMTSQGQPQTPQSTQRPKALQHSPFDDDSLFPQGFAMDPFEDMQSMMERMDALISSMGAPQQPGLALSIPGRGLHSMPSGITQDANGNYVYRLDMPGIDKSQVKASVDGGMLSISAESKAEMKSDAKGGSFSSRSYSSSSFHSCLPLPGPVKADGLKIEADASGIVIKIPKA